MEHPEEKHIYSLHEGISLPYTRLQEENIIKSNFFLRALVWEFSQLTLNTSTQETFLPHLVMGSMQQLIDFKKQLAGVVHNTL